jgi:hypothetical protein
MNPQPDPSIGIIFAFVVMCGIVYYAYKAFVYGPHINLRDDLFTIGYVEANNINVRVHHKPVVAQNTQLYMDCIESLHSLGMKKSEAKRITKSIFENHNPTNVQEFLVLALRK